MKNKNRKAKPAPAIARPLYYISEVERDLIVIAFAQILPVEKPPENFSRWVIETVNKLAGDQVVIRKIVENLETTNKLRLNQVREKNALLRVLLPPYVEALG